ncbi:MAG TPA: T9SS type A sorting domain-containing protein [Flavobacteriales bacterium]|nr:T9SS type A sorting domain-containing protein [Flavobacteriales bacterium]
MKKSLFALLYLLSSYSFSQTIKSFSYAPDSLMEAGASKLLENGYIVTGKYYAGGSYVNYAVRYNNNGTVKWTRQESAGHIKAIVDVAEDENKSLYFLAEDPTSYSYYTLLKTDSMGNFSWSVDLDKTGFSSYGSPRLMPDGNGNIYALSSTYEKTHLYKLDGITGSAVWSRTFDIDFVTEKNPGFDLILTGDGGVICTGKADSDVFMVCVSPTGNLNWTKRMNDFGNSYCHAKCITRLADGNYLIAGFRGENMSLYRSGIFLLKIDSLGAILDYRFYFDSLNIHSFVPENIVELPGGNIRVTGNGGPLTIADFDASLNMTGYIFWTEVMNAQTTSNCFDMVNNQLLITCGDRVDKQFILRSLNASTAFCQMDFSATYGSYDLAINEGDYTSDINFNSGPGAIPSVTSLFAVTSYSHDFYCGSNEITLGEAASLFQAEVAIYPNPVTAGETITINTNNMSAGSYMLYNANGAVLRSDLIQQGQSLITTADLAPGVYFLRLFDGKLAKGSHKIIVR